MKKCLAILISALLLSSIPISQARAQTTLNLGEVANSFTAATLTASEGRSYALPSVATQITWTVVFGTAPSSVTVNLMGSLNNSDWMIIDRSILTTGEMRTTSTSSRFVRIDVAASSGGTTITALLIAKTGPIASVAVDQTSYIQLDDDIRLTNVDSGESSNRLGIRNGLDTAYKDIEADDAFFDEIDSTNLTTDGIVTGTLEATTITTPTVYTPVINGGTAANDDITIQGTTNATKTTSYVNLQPTGGNVGIGITTPTAALDVVGSSKLSGILNLSGTNQIHLISGHSLFQGDANFTYFYGGVAGIQIRKADNSTALFGISDTGGITTEGGAAPAVSNTTANSCGTTAAILVGNDNNGAITVGTVSGTSCTVTFVNTAINRRECFANNETTANLVRAVYVSTTVSKFEGTFVGGDVITYICFRR